MQLLKPEIYFCLPHILFKHFADIAAKVLTLTERREVLGVVDELACRRQMLGPNLGIGGQLVAPHKLVAW